MRVRSAAGAVLAGVLTAAGTPAAAVPAGAGVPMTSTPLPGVPGAVGPVVEVPGLAADDGEAVTHANAAGDVALLQNRPRRNVFGSPRVVRLWTYAAATGTWSGPYRLPGVLPGGASFESTLGGDGAVTALWTARSHGRTRLQVARWDPASRAWQPPERLAGSPLAKPNAVLDSDDSGQVTVAWNSPKGLAAKCSSGQGWEPAQVVAAIPIKQQGYLSLTAIGTGLWLLSSSGGYSGYRPPGGGWAPRPELPEVPGTAEAVASAAYNRNGQLARGWWTREPDPATGGDRWTFWYQRIDLLSGIVSPAVGSPLAVGPKGVGESYLAHRADGRVALAWSEGSIVTEAFHAAAQGPDGTLLALPDPPVPAPSYPVLGTALVRFAWTGPDALVAVSTVQANECNISAPSPGSDCMGWPTVPFASWLDPATGAWSAPFAFAGQGPLLAPDGSAVIVHPLSGQSARYTPPSVP